MFGLYFHPTFLTKALLITWHKYGWENVAKTLCIIYHKVVYEVNAQNGFVNIGY